jgi:hypothetical protein
MISNTDAVWIIKSESEHGIYCAETNVSLLQMTDTEVLL